MAKFEVCNYCGKIIPWNEMFHKNQRICLNCASIPRPPNFVFDCGTFHLELQTELMTNKQLQKVLRKLPKG